MKRFFVLLLCLASSGPAVLAQGALHFKSTVHDFGQVLISDGPLSCSFTATNDSSEGVSIRSVTTSCGCTGVKWNKEEIRPGESTEISVTYTNDEGPYPFEKTITVYVQGQSRPTVLRIRGVSQNRKLSDAEMFTRVFCGSFAMSETSLRCGNIEQGGSRGDQCTVANLSSAPINVSFTGVSKGLSITLTPNPIPAKGHATLRYTINALEDKWGWNDYVATPSVNGRTEPSKVISIKAFTADNFSSLTQTEKARGSRPIFEQSTFSFGHARQGDRINATFVCQNKGQSTLHIHKVDVDCQPSEVASLKDIPAGAKGELRLSVNTKNLPKGEALVIVTLTTNSPIRPIVTLFLAGWID